MTLTIVANIHAVKGKEDLLKAELEKLIDVSRADAGCLQYDLHVDNDDPTHFLFFEQWESRALWQDHMNMPHLTAYIVATEGAVDRYTVNEMTRI
ncbi:lipoprotein [Pseudovibrio japonicus]|uniref:Lipoprotein n=1 Tax=Pseudovibrio japonicus TaxID=366534 RepID=A0ABQ3DZN6_9HYPH|nr:putative quinol monooxygenase [Pseudovibrio japonicus]GHB19025.1 lipoprotein [Pseudovibrio japonicus]